MNFSRLITFLTISLFTYTSCDLLGSKELETDCPCAVNEKQFTINHQQSFSLRNCLIETIKFDSVITDSRCPINANCVWAGTASIKILLNNNAITLEISKPVNYQINNESYELTLIQLDPHPVAPIPQNPDNYKATIKIRKL